MTKGPKIPTAAKDVQMLLLDEEDFEFHDTYEDIVLKNPHSPEESIQPESSTSTYVHVDEEKLTQSKVPIEDLTVNEQNYIYVSRVTKNFSPLKYLLTAFGRWPIAETKNSDGTRDYKWSWKHPNGIYFIFISGIIFYSLLMGSYNMLAVLLKWREPHQKGKEFLKYEIILLKRHLVTFVVIWTSLLHCTVVSISFITKRKYYEKYFTFWTRSMQMMHMDAAKGLGGLTLTMAICYMGCILTLILFSLLQVGPTAVASPTLFGVLMSREYAPPLFSYSQVPQSTTTAAPTPPGPPPPTLATLYDYTIFDDYPAIRMTMAIIGGIFLIIIYTVSKLYMLVYIYKCKLLKNAFATWNGRVYAAVLQGDAELQSAHSRTTYTLLFRDHCVLLDLVEGTDQLFSTILESYFGLQICSICFEMYFFLRTAHFGTAVVDAQSKGFFIRPYDWAPGVIVFVQSSFILVLVCIAAAEVGEEAVAGMEVLRRKSLMGRKTNEELYFMLTMFASYTAYKKIELTGGGYFGINKEFMIGVISTLFSYFIILYQFQPFLDQSTAKDKNNRQLYGKFIAHLEGIDQNAVIGTE